MARGYFSTQPSGTDKRTVKTDEKMQKEDRNLEKPRTNNAHTSYERYKASLHAIFDGRAPMPTHLRDISEHKEAGPLDLEPDISAIQAPAKASKPSRRLSSTQLPYSVFTEALKRASTHDEMRRSVEALLEASHPFPEDEDLLSKALTYPSEDFVIGLLDKLEAILDAHPPKNPRLLASRLDDAAFSTRPGAAKDRILALKEKLKG